MLIGKRFLFVSFIFSRGSLSKDSPLLLEHRGETGSALDRFFDTLHQPVFTTPDGC